MKIKRLPLDPYIQFEDVNGIARKWRGIPLNKRIEYLTLKGKIADSSSATHTDENLIDRALIIAGFKPDWITNRETGQSILESIMIGILTEENLEFSIVEQWEYPFHYIPVPAELKQSDNSNQPQGVERFDRLWLETISRERLVVKPLSCSARRELDGYYQVISELAAEKDVRKIYDIDSDFRYAIDSVLDLYGISAGDINSQQMIELIFDPGWLGSIEIPLAEYMDESPLPSTENPYDSAIASLLMSFQGVDPSSVTSFIESMPWVQLSSVLESMRRINDRQMEEIKGAKSGRKGFKGKASKPSNGSEKKPWTKDDFSQTRDLLSKLKKGELETKPLPKFAQKALGGG